MPPTNSAQSQELNELRNRLEWLDAERRKFARKLAEMEQKQALQEREIAGREQRIQDLEQQLSTVMAQLSRLPQLDPLMAQFKDDVVHLIEQYDQRRLQSEAEMDRLRRVEQEGNVREIASIRKELPTIGRLQNEMEQRQAEEARLANLIGMQQGRLSALEHQVEDWERSLAFQEEKEKQDSRNIAEVQANLVEVNKRWAPINDRQDVLSSKITRLETSIQGLAAAQTELRESSKAWMEQIQIGEYERNQRLENWRHVLEDHQDTIERFAKEWITFSDQYKEAKMAVQTLADWQRQIEQQQRETAEMMRVEAHRMQSRWDTFTLENEKKWKSFTVENEQRWSAVNRSERQVQEQFAAVEETLTRFQQDKELIWRVQAAQTDAIKQWPRLWLEEVEKAMAQNPNRRRQPALVPVPEE